MTIQFLSQSVELRVLLGPILDAIPVYLTKQGILEKVGKSEAMITELFRESATTPLLQAKAASVFALYCFFIHLEDENCPKLRDSATQESVLKAWTVLTGQPVPTVSLNGDRSMVSYARSFFRDESGTDDPTYTKVCDALMSVYRMSSTRSLEDICKRYDLGTAMYVHDCFYGILQEAVVAALKSDNDRLDACVTMALGIMNGLWIVGYDFVTERLTFAVAS